MKGTRLFLFAIAVALVLGCETRTTLAGGENLLRVESRSAIVGELVPITVEALGIPSPGTGAWTIDIEYKPDVLEAVDCVAYLDGVCNVDFGQSTVRTLGASATALTGDFRLATFVFRCLQPGRGTGLETSLEMWGSSIGPPGETDYPSIRHGTVSCLGPGTEPSSRTPQTPPATATPQPVLPTTGAGGGANSSSMPLWPIAALAALGIAAAFGAVAARRRA